MGLALLVCLGVIRRVSLAAGATHLERTYAQVLGDQPSTAYKLIDISIKLDQLGYFPESEVLELVKLLNKQFVPMWVLRALVSNNFSIFPSDLGVRQRISEKLKLSPDSTRGISPSLISRDSQIQRPKLKD